MSDHRWRGYPHEELHTMINAGPGVSASIPLEDQWKNLASALTRIDGDLHKALGKMGADWEGSTAEAATTALSPLAEWANDASQGSTTMESSARLQGEYVADARKKMPEPVPVKTEAPGFWDKVGGAMTGPVGMAHVIDQQNDHEQEEAAQENAQMQAIKVMEDYESSSTWNRDTLGEFHEPPQVVIDTPPPAGSSNQNSVGVNQGTAPTVNGNDSTTTSWAPPPTGTPVNQPPVTTTTGGGTTHTSWVEPPNGRPLTPPALPPFTPTPDQTTTRPGGPNTVPPVFTRPDGISTGRGGGGGGGTGGGKGLGGAGKAFGSMSGGLGGGSGMKGVAGMTAGAMGDPDGHVNRGAAAGAGAAGKSGAAGAGAMGGAAGRGQGQGDDDIEHKAADYLVETDDVFGDERLVAPPVIGGAPDA